MEEYTLKELMKGLTIISKRIYRDSRPSQRKQLAVDILCEACKRFGTEEYENQLKCYVDSIKFFYSFHTNESIPYTKLCRTHENKLYLVADFEEYLKYNEYQASLYDDFKRTHPLIEVTSLSEDYYMENIVDNIAQTLEWNDNNVKIEYPCLIGLIDKMCESPKLGSCVTFGVIQRPHLKRGWYCEGELSEYKISIEKVKGEVVLSLVKLDASSLFDKERIFETDISQINEGNKFGIVLKENCFNITKEDEYEIEILLNRERTSFKDMKRLPFASNIYDFKELTTYKFGKHLLLDADNVLI